MVAVAETGPCEWLQLKRGWINPDGATGNRDGWRNTNVRLVTAGSGWRGESWVRTGRTVLTSYHLIGPPQHAPTTPPWLPAHGPMDDGTQPGQLISCEDRGQAVLGRSWSTPPRTGRRVNMDVGQTSPLPSQSPTVRTTPPRSALVKLFVPQPRGTFEP